jgi:hypothetical protein
MMKNPKMLFTCVKGYGIKYRFHDNNIHKNIARQIIGVAQILKRYFPERPIPKKLISWTKMALKQRPLSQNIEIFTVSDKMRALLDDPEIIDSIIKPTKLKAKQYLFRKIKHANGLREVYIFGFIYIRYWKKEK